MENRITTSTISLSDADKENFETEIQPVGGYSIVVLTLSQFLSNYPLVVIQIVSQTVLHLPQNEKKFN